MDLDEMKEVWTEMSQELQKQKKITTQMVEKMTKIEYRNRMNKIVIPEIIGGIVCGASALYIIFNINKMDSWYLIVSAVVTLLILIVLPLLSFRSLRNIYNISPAVHNYKETLIKYNRGKKQLKFVQQLSVYLSFILMFAMIPVCLKLFSNKDLSQFNYEKLLWTMPIAIIFIILFTRWVLKCYRNVIKGTDALLAELDEE
ncbi:hypothetical protein ACJD0Z_04485 [Flavobacteriaceae bacterium M23B6Z8]